MASRLPLSAYPLLVRQGVVGLAYHIVSDEGSPAVRHLYPYKTPAMFEHDLRFVKEHCSVVSYEQLRSGAKAPKGSILLTFDDGYRECLTVVRPLLLKFGIPCVFFVTSDFIDNRRLFYRNKVSLCIDRIPALEPDQLAAACSIMKSEAPGQVADGSSLAIWLKSLKRADETLIDRICEAIGVDAAAYLRDQRPFLNTDEIRQLAADGFTIGAHSCSHARLGELPADAVDAEVIESCRRVRQITGQADVPFAFPFSSDGVDLRRVSALRRQAEFLGSLFDCRGITGNGSLVVDRVWADPPPDTQEKGSNLGTLLRSAYREFVSSEW